MVTLGDLYNSDAQPQQAQPQTFVDNSASQTPSDPVGNFVGGVANNIAQSPIGQGIGNIFGGINNFLSPQRAINPSAPDTFSLIGDALSVPQRALFSAASPIIQGIKGNKNPAPNYFDFTQNPGSQLDKQITGGNSFLGDLGFGLLDPLMLLGGPEGDIAKATLESGKTVGLGKEAVQAMDALSQSRYGKGLADLAVGKNGDTLVQNLRNEVANTMSKSNPSALKNLGVTFAGKTIVPQEALDAIGNKVGSAVKGIPELPGVRDVVNSPFGQEAQNAIGAINKQVKLLFNTKETNAGPLTDLEAKLLSPLQNAGNVARSKAVNLVKGLFSGFNQKMGDAFYNIAKFGLPTVDGVMNRTELVGKSLAELQNLAPSVDSKVLSTYHSYINTVLPEMSQIARDEFGLSSQHEAENYIHDLMTSKQTRGQQFGTAPMQSKLINKSGSTKEKVVSAQMDAEAARQAGFETNPAVNVGRMAHERWMAQERNNAVRDILNNPDVSHKVTAQDLINPTHEHADAVPGWLQGKGFKQDENGKWISPKGKAPSAGEALQFWKDQKGEDGQALHGIYQPEGNLRFFKDVSNNSVSVTKNVPSFVVSKPMAAKLNELRVGDAWKAGPLAQLMKSTSNGLLKLQFASPVFAAVHGLWHLLPNAFMESGRDLFNKDAWSQAINDVKTNSPFFQKLSEMGALPHVLDKSSSDFNETLRQAAGGNGTREAYLRMLWNNGPLGKDWAPNNWLGKEDNILRTMLVRNNLNKGMTLSESVGRVNKFLVDYNNLTTGEKATLRLFMPFYAWTKGNLGAQVAGWMEHPWRQMIPGKVMDVLNQEFSGHNMASNESGKQQNIDLGKTPTGQENYLNVPLGSKDIGSLINDPGQFIKGRMGQAEKIGSVALTGTENGYPVTDSTSPTPMGVQTATGIANSAGLDTVAQDLGLNAPTLERKALGIGLSSAQYPKNQPATLKDWLGKTAFGLTGMSQSATSTPDQKQSLQQYLNNKYTKSLRKKGL